MRYIVKAPRGNMTAEVTREQWQKDNGTKAILGDDNRLIGWSQQVVGWVDDAGLWELDRAVETLTGNGRPVLTKES